MTNLQQHLNNMYIGLVFTYWSDSNTKMGTAKHKALQQMQSFSQTIDKNNSMSDMVKKQIGEMSRSVSKQIMTDKSSEFVLDKMFAPQYRAFGEQQVANSKKALNAMIEHAKESARPNITRGRLEELHYASEKQDMFAKRKAPQYRPLNTNVPAKAPIPKPQQKMVQETLIRILSQQNWQNAA